MPIGRVRDIDPVGQLDLGHRPFHHHRSLRFSGGHHPAVLAVHHHGIPGRQGRLVRHRPGQRPTLVQRPGKTVERSAVRHMGHENDGLPRTGGQIQRNPVVRHRPRLVRILHEIARRIELQDGDISHRILLRPIEFGPSHVERTGMQLKNGPPRSGRRFYGGVPLTGTHRDGHQ